MGQALSSNESWVGGIPKGAQSAVNNFADGVWYVLHVWAGVQDLKFNLLI